MSSEIVSGVETPIFRPAYVPAPNLPLVPVDFERENKRILRALSDLVEDSDVSLDDIDKGAGWKRGYVSQVFNRRVRLRYDHILAILDACGAPPTAFFGALFRGGKFFLEEMKEIAGAAYPAPRVESDVVAEDDEISEAEKNALLLKLRKLFAKELGDVERPREAELSSTGPATPRSPRGR